MKIAKWIFILAVFLLSSSCTEGQQTGELNETINMLVGVWPYSNNSRGLLEKEFSWGIGLYQPNDSIIIDYDSDEKLYIVNPGLGEYWVTSINFISEGSLKLNLEKAEGNHIKNVPQSGSIVVSFVSEREMKIDDSEYAGMFGSPGDTVFQKLSPP